MVGYNTLFSIMSSHRENSCIQNLIITKYRSSQMHDRLRDGIEQAGCVEAYSDGQEVPVKLRVARVAGDLLK